MESGKAVMTRGREFIGKVHGGQLPAAVRKAIAEAIRRMEGKSLRVTLAEAKKRRSTRQNAYMWAVPIRMITDAFRDAGNVVDEDEVHEYLKAEIGKLRRKVVTQEGEVIDMPASTKHLTTSQMEDYLEKVRAWAAEVLDLQIPLPNEELQNDY